MKKNIFILIITLFVFCQSCSKEAIPTDFQKYVDSFVAEAQKRGKSYNIKKLKITFDDLPNSISGQAHLGSYNIQIDRTYWKRQGDLGAEIARESLIYHEMGHAVLSREHRNDVLPDGSSSSIMCGAGGDYCGAPFGGMRKKYYLDELFDSTTPIPAWADYSNFKDDYLGNKRQLIVSEEFNDFKNFESTKPANATIDNGVMNVNAENNKTSFLSFQNFLPYFTNPEKNIEIEVRFFLPKGSFSLIWTPVFESQTDGFSLIISNQQTTQLNLSLNSAVYATSITKSMDSFFIKNDFNILKLRRIDNNVYYFLNNKILYISDLIEVPTPYITSNNQNVYWVFNLGIFSGNCQLDYVRVNKIVL